MPLTAPNLDDRNFEELLEEAKRRIPVHTPEWTNFDVESDPGITLVQLFAFLTDNLLYRANRIPERNRHKFLQLLDIGLQPAAAARGIISIRNERGPLQALPLDAGVVVSAGNVEFLTRDGVNVLPVEGQIFYKRSISQDEEGYAQLVRDYEGAILAAQAEQQDELSENLDAEVLVPSFYETVQLPLPKSGAPDPVVDIENDTLDGLFLALLAPPKVDPESVRSVIANQVLSIGVAPALAEKIAPLSPQRTTRVRGSMPTLTLDVVDPTAGDRTAQYRPLPLLRQPDVFNDLGVIQVRLPASAELLRTVELPEPFDEGKGAFPPRIEDDAIRSRIVTWIRLRVDTGDEPSANGASTGVSTGAITPGSSASARLSWVGVNACRIGQAIPVLHEALGNGNGEPDQAYTLANRPVLPASLRVETLGEDGAWLAWRLTDDLLAADEDERVVALDPEAGLLRFGDGLRGQRPPFGRPLRASYEYGGGVQGNVNIGAVNKSSDLKLQAGYKVGNPIPTYGGDDGETVAEGEKQIPLYLRHRDRLVTAADFRDIAMRTPGVNMGRVEVLSLFNPSLETPEPSAGTVTLLAVPGSDALRPLWPTPNLLFLRTVCDYLAPRRLVTTEIFVRGPIYRSVYISVGIQVREGHFADVVRQDVQNRLEIYLSSLPPGGPEEAGWTLNRPVIARELDAVAARVPGVEYVHGLLLIDDESTTDQDEIPFYGLALPLLAGVSVREGTPDPVVGLRGVPEGPDAPAAAFVPMPVSRPKC